MVRKFVYHTDPGEIEAYVQELGYNTEKVQYRHGGEPFGFTIIGTTLTVTYRTLDQHPITGDWLTRTDGLVTLDNNPYSRGYTPEVADLSLKLYRRLQRRFGKP